MTDQEIMQEELESLRADLIARYNELGMPASGEWSESVELIAKGSSGIIMANDYTWYMEHGRKPGKFPPIMAIEKWINDKGIPVTDISVSSLAFIIARKIAKEGTKYFQMGGSNFVDSVVTAERIQKIIDRLSRFQIGEFQSQIIEQFKLVKI